MATNLVALNVYQFNQKPINVNGVISKRIAFNTQGFIVQDCSADLTTRSLSTGVNVYSALQGSDGTLYYVRELQSAVIALFNA